MAQGILFDMGGTLDGDGLHWLDRFGDLYEQAGISVTREALRAAFDAAERRANADEKIARAPLAAMIDRHVSWQFEHLGLADSRLRAALVANFVAPVRRAARANVEMLSGLKARGFELGVVSNGCGNVDVLCDDLGYAPFLSIVVDSRQVGLYKPDPAIYVYAASRLGLACSSIMMVGDSFDRDIRPAKSVGMRTAWLHGPGVVTCPDPAAVDIMLSALSDLPAALGVRERTVA